MSKHNSFKKARSKGAQNVLPRIERLKALESAGKNPSDSWTGLPKMKVRG